MRRSCPPPPAGIRCVRYDSRVKRERIGRVERIEQAGVAAALIALVAWAFYQRWQLLAASPFPLGVDGYFYPVQVRALLEHGALQYPSSPLTFWFMAPFAAATDPITGAKLGAALGGALVALPAYAVGARFARVQHGGPAMEGASRGGRDRGRGPGLVAAALASASACSTYLSIEFVKQGVGLTVGLTALWLLLRALETPSRARIGAAVGGLIATLLAHKLAAGALIVIAIPAAIEEARGRAVLRGRRLLVLLATVVVFAIVALVLGLVFPQRFLSPHDAALVGNLFTTDAHWSAPALATGRLTLAFGHEAAYAAVMAIAAIVALRARHRRQGGSRALGERAAMWGVIGLGLVIGLPWLAVSDPQGLGFRLRLAAFVPLALCGAIVTGAVVDAVLAWLPRRGRDGDHATTSQLPQLVRDAGLAALALVIAVCPHGRPTEGMVVAHPAMVSAVMASARQIPPGATVIVPERHILFMIAWYARAKVSLTPDAVPYAERVRMMPLAFIGKDSPLDAALDRARAEPGIAPPLGFHPRYRNGLVLVTEPTWDWLLAQLPPEARAHWARWPTI